jgi:hypothetical protein
VTVRLLDTVNVIVLPLDNSVAATISVAASFYSYAIFRVHVACVLLVADADLPDGR